MVILTLASLVSLPDAARTQMGPDYWQVTDVPSDDTLNIRSGPGISNRVVARAPNGAVLRNLRCRGEGNARWCHLETPNGQISGWAALINPIGRVITAERSSTRANGSAADEALASYLRENSPTADHGGGGATTDVSGSGTMHGDASLIGRIFGHKEGAYALTVSGDGLTCTGLFRHAFRYLRRLTRTHGVRRLTSIITVFFSPCLAGSPAIIRAKTPLSLHRFQRL